MEKSTEISRYRKLTMQSEGWLIDSLSDANGVSFHRFQLFSWTVILGGVFVVNTYRELNMPVFDTTLMGLLGLSAATYLGLKVPETESTTGAKPGRLLTIVSATNGHARVRSRSRARCREMAGAPAYSCVIPSSLTWLAFGTPALAGDISQQREIFEALTAAGDPDRLEQQGLLGLLRGSDLLSSASRAKRYAIGLLCECAALARRNPDEPRLARYRGAPDEPRVSHFDPPDPNNSLCA